MQKKQPSQSRNFFLSSTFFGFVLLFLQLLQPEVEYMIKNGRSFRSLWNILMATATSVFTLAKTVEEGGTFYTPHNLPGRNKEDV